MLVKSLDASPSARSKTSRTNANNPKREITTERKAEAFSTPARCPASRIARGVRAIKSTMSTMTGAAIAIKFWAMLKTRRRHHL